MLKFFEFVARFREHVTFAMLVVISFALMSIDQEGDLRGFRTALIGGVSIVQSTFTGLFNPFALQAENEALRRLNYTLNREIIKTRSANVENENLRLLLKIKEEEQQKVVAAEVVGKVASQTRMLFTLNAGRLDSIAEGMSVITNRGLAGKIIASSDNYSILQPITYRNTSIAARLEEANVNGILVWVQGNTFLLKNIAKTQQVQAGDNVLTSQFSTIYPPDVYIGRVVDVRDEPNTLFRKITVAPFVNFTALSSVLVDIRQRDEELVGLETSIREQTDE